MPKWHKEGRFGPGPRLPMDRERRAVWRARLAMFRRAGKITALHEQIGLALLRRLGEDGRLDPSHETITIDAGCSDRTVRRALEALKACGLVLWVQRLVRAGWRVAQTSSAYVLAIGAEIPALLTKVSKRVARTTCPPQQTVTNPAPLCDIREAQRALAGRRKVIEEELRAKFTASSVRVAL